MGLGIFTLFKMINPVLEFERMRKLAELKALSNLSLTEPLNDKQFKRMMELKERFLKWKNSN